MELMLEREPAKSAVHSHGSAVSVLRNLPDHCAANVSELARQIGADKLDLLRWSRADIKFARLIASKVSA
jgi:hypothetical protein